MSIPRVDQAVPSPVQEAPAALPPSNGAPMVAPSSMQSLAPPQENVSIFQCCINLLKKCFDFIQFWKRCGAQPNAAPIPPSALPVLQPGSPPPRPQPREILPPSANPVRPSPNSLSPQLAQILNQLSEALAYDPLIPEQPGEIRLCVYSSSNPEVREAIIARDEERLYNALLAQRQRGSIGRGCNPPGISNQRFQELNQNIPSEERMLLRPFFQVFPDHLAPIPAGN